MKKTFWLMAAVLFICCGLVSAQEWGWLCEDGCDAVACDGLPYTCKAGSHGDLCVAKGFDYGACGGTTDKGGYCFECSGGCEDMTSTPGTCGGASCDRYCCRDPVGTGTGDEKCVDKGFDCGCCGGPEGSGSCIRRITGDITNNGGTPETNMVEFYVAEGMGCTPEPAESDFTEITTSCVEFNYGQGELTVTVDGGESKEVKCTSRDELPHEDDGPHCVKFKWGTNIAFTEYGGSAVVPEFDLIVVNDDWDAILSVAPIAVKEDVPLLIQGMASGYFIEDYVESTGKNKVLSLDGACTSPPSNAVLAADMLYEEFITAYWKKNPSTEGYGIYTDKTSPDGKTLANALYAAVKGIPFVSDKNLLDDMGVTDQQNEPKTREEVNSEVISGGGYVAPTLTVTNPSDYLAPLAVVYAAYRKTPIAFVSSYKCEDATPEVIAQAEELSSFFNLDSGVLADQYMTFVVTETGLKHLTTPETSVHTGYTYYANCDATIANFDNKDPYHNRNHPLFGPGRIGYNMREDQSAALIARGVFYDQLEKTGKVLLHQNYIEKLPPDSEFDHTRYIDEELPLFKVGSDVIAVLGADDLSPFLGDVDVVIYHAHNLEEPSVNERTHSAIIVGSSCGSNRMVQNYAYGMSAFIGSTTTISTLKFERDTFIAGASLGRCINRTTDSLLRDKGMIVYGDPLIKFKSAGSGAEPIVYAVGVTALSTEPPNKVDTKDTYFLSQVFSPNFKEKRATSWFNEMEYISGVPINSFEIAKVYGGFDKYSSAVIDCTGTTCNFKLNGISVYLPKILLSAKAEYKGKEIKIPVYPSALLGYLQPDPNPSPEIDFKNIENTFHSHASGDDSSTLKLTVENSRLDLTNAWVEITAKNYLSCDSRSETKRVDGLTVTSTNSIDLVFDDLCKTDTFEIKVGGTFISGGNTGDYTEVFCITDDPTSIGTYDLDECPDKLIIVSPQTNDRLKDPVDVDLRIFSDETSDLQYQITLHCAGGQNYKFDKITPDHYVTIRAENCMHCWDSRVTITSMVYLPQSSVPLRGSNIVDIDMVSPDNVPIIEITSPHSSQSISASPIDINVKLTRPTSGPYQYTATLYCNTLEFPASKVDSSDAGTTVSLDFDKTACKTAIGSGWAELIVEIEDANGNQYADRVNSLNIIA